MGVVNSGLRPELPPGTQPELAALVHACWSARPEERPTFVEIGRLLAALREQVGAAQRRRNSHSGMT